MKEQIQRLKNEIDRGREGKSIWIPIGFPKMGEHIGIGQKIYTLIGGNSGTGKTAFTDLAYVFHPYLWMKRNKDLGIKIRWIYRSMERSQTFKLAKWAGLILYYKYGLVFDVPTILNRGGKGKHLTKEGHYRIDETYAILDEMLDYIELIDGPMNPTGVFEHVREYANKVGIIEKVPYTTKEGLVKHHKIYKLHDDKLITIIILDHVGKCKGETIRGTNTFLAPQSKGLLDKMSDYCGSEFRDFYGFNPVAVSQFNRGMEDVMRRVKTDNSPLPGDFKGSGNMYEDADIALAMYNPFKLGDDDNLGYQIPRFVNKQGHNQFRSAYVLKNSYGVDDIAFGYYFRGEIGLMQELPKADTLQPNDYKNILNGTFKF